MSQAGIEPATSHLSNVHSNLWVTDSIFFSYKLFYNDKLFWKFKKEIISLGSEAITAFLKGLYML